MIITVRKECVNELRIRMSLLAKNTVFLYTYDYLRVFTYPVTQIQKRKEDQSSFLQVNRTTFLSGCTDDP